MIFPRGPSAKRSACEEVYDDICPRAIGQRDICTINLRCIIL